MCLSMKIWGTPDHMFQKQNVRIAWPASQSGSLPVTWHSLFSNTSGKGKSCTEWVGWHRHSVKLTKHITKPKGLSGQLTSRRLQPIGRQPQIMRRGHKSKLGIIHILFRIKQIKRCLLPKLGFTGDASGNKLGRFQLSLNCVKIDFCCLLGAKRRPRQSPQYSGVASTGEICSG